MRGTTGYGRYDDDPKHVGCPYAKSDMTPCIARDGHTALAGEPPSDCVGCARTPAWLLGEFSVEWEPARTIRAEVLNDPGRAADLLTYMVAEATEKMLPPEVLASLTRGG